MPKKENIQNMFDSIAPEYDYLNHLLSMDIDKRWRKKAVKEIVDTEKPQKILDVACGTCDFTIAIARKAMADNAYEGELHTEITGIDISEGMMRIGKKKLAKAGFCKDGDFVSVELIQGDCECLPFEQNSFDRISAGFGVRNFEHLDQGLKEMYRTLKPGGKVVILELSVPGNRIIRNLYKMYFTKLLPLIGGRISGKRSAYNYLPASVLKFPGPNEFQGMLRNAGFKNIRHKALSLGICRLYTGTKQ